MAKPAHIELLAPARDADIAIAAIDHGADAVYMGASHHGARADATNTLDDVRRACDYAHQFGARIYATVNTLVYDDELKEVEHLVHDLYHIGVDALIVQDMALLRLDLPPIALHASTQCDLRTPEKARFLEALGFSQLVMARELTLDEIAAIRRVTTVPLEAFVHGALCVSYSGRCAISQVLKGRSANRGECAQLCRLPYDLVDGKGNVIVEGKHLLSLRDMARHDRLEQMMAAGVSSFKIEGRLKDVPYVKNVTAAYSQRLNQIISRHPDQYCRSSKGECHYTFTPDLNRTFNRGYTNYFLHGRQPDIASFDTPKARGEFVGTVKEIRHDSFNVAGTASFANGDGLCFFNKERQLVGFRANRVVGNRIYPYRMPQGLLSGMRLCRNNDQEFERLLSRPSAERKIPIRLSLRAVDDGFELNGIRFTAEHQMAQKPQRENIIRQLTKLGDTIYTCEEVDIPEDFNYFIPNSVLSEMRRTLMEKMRNEIFGMRNDDIRTNPCSANRGYQHSSFLTSHFSYPYLSNISNRLSQQFYGSKELTAYELKGGSGPIMQCRHCIRYALGYCVKHGGLRPTWHEPLSLVLGDGRRFRLEFDCQHCQMNVYAS